MDERIIIDLVATCLEQGPVLNEKVVPRVEQLSKLLYERSSNGELLVTLASLIATVCFHVTTDMKGSSPATEYEAESVPAEEGAPRVWC